LVVVGIVVPVLVLVVIVEVLELSALIDNILVVVVCNLVVADNISGSDVDSVTIDGEAVVSGITPSAGNLFVFDNIVLANSLSVDWAWLSRNGTSGQQKSWASWRGTANVGGNNLDAVLGTNEKILSVVRSISQGVDIVVSVEVMVITV
jgi:hypothetical protein